MEFNGKEIDEVKIAEVAALITGDGHLQSKGWRHQVSYYSKEPEEIKRIDSLFQELFNVEGKLYLDRSASATVRSITRYKLFFIDKNLTLFLKDCGVPAGNKTNFSFEVPEWVINSNSKVKSAYLRGLFDAEGCMSVAKTKKSRCRIKFDMGKNENLLPEGICFLNQLREMLLCLGVRSSPVRTCKGNLRKDGSMSIMMRFEIEQSSFVAFYKNINFNNEKKREILKAVIKKLEL